MLLSCLPILLFFLLLSFHSFILGKKHAVVNVEYDEEEPQISKKRTRSNDFQINKPSDPLTPKYHCQNMVAIGNTSHTGQNIVAYKI